jgi:hypothetical protein
MTANEIIGAANNAYLRDKDPHVLAAAYDLAAEWHEKQAVSCDAVAWDEPRIDATTRARAAAAATHHRASAAGLRLAATNLRRAA